MNLYNTQLHVWSHDSHVTYLLLSQATPGHTSYVVLFKYWGGGTLVVPPSLKKLFSIQLPQGRQPEESRQLPADERKKGPQEEEEGTSEEESTSEEEEAAEV